MKNKTDPKLSDVGNQAEDPVKLSDKTQSFKHVKILLKKDACTNQSF